MALCIAIDTDGSVIATGEPVESCSGYVLVSGSEHATHTVIDRLFEWPDTAVSAGWLVGSFGFVFVTYLVGRLVGSVINMFHK